MPRRRFRPTPRARSGWLDFVKVHPVAHVLGTHIEQGIQPYFDYPRGTAYQPKEHVLELSRAHVVELAEAFRKMDGKPVNQVYPDFAVVARATNAPRAENFQAGDWLGTAAGSATHRAGGPAVPIALRFRTGRSRNTTRISISCANPVA